MDIDFCSITSSVKRLSLNVQNSNTFSDQMLSDICITSIIKEVEFYGQHLFIV